MVCFAKPSGLPADMVLHSTPLNAIGTPRCRLDAIRRCNDRRVLALGASAVPAARRPLRSRLGVLKPRLLLAEGVLPGPWS